MSKDRVCGEPDCLNAGQWFDCGHVVCEFHQMEGSCGRCDTYDNDIANLQQTVRELESEISIWKRNYIDRTTQLVSLYSKQKALKEPRCTCPDWEKKQVSTNCVVHMQEIIAGYGQEKKEGSDVVERK